MASMLTTIWLVLGALSFAAVMEHAGFLQRLLEPVVARARRRGSLIAAVNASGIGLNVIAGDQYVADVLPARMFRKEFARRGLAPQVLSRAVEDSGTVTSVLVPWNTCGAYISGVLGVSTAAYFPFCFFNLLSPLLDIVYGFIGFKVPPPRRPGTTTPRPPRSRPYQEETPMSDTTTTAGRAAAGVQAAVGVHDPVRPDRADGDRHLDRAGGRLRAWTRTGARSPAPTTPSTRTRRGSSSTR